MKPDPLESNYQARRARLVHAQRVREVFGDLLIAAGLVALAIFAVLSIR